MKKTEQAKFKAGDLVCLKAGGPPLSVRSRSGNKIEVEWFSGDKPMKHVYLDVQLTACASSLTDLEVAHRIAYLLSKEKLELPQ